MKQVKTAKRPAMLPVQDQLNPTQRKSIGARGKYEKRERLEGEALPIIFRESKINPFPSMATVRAGAEDYKKIASLGTRC